MKKAKWKEILKNLLFILIGSALYATGVSLFLDPNQLAPGGVTGISVIVNTLVPIGTGTWYLLINIPILIFGTWRFGFRFILKTALCIALISVLTNYLSRFPVVTEDLLLAALIGGSLMAIGIGLSMKAGATTGGADILVKALRQRFPYLKTGFIYLCFDMIVVAVSALVFRNINIALYALLTVIISGRVLDQVLYGSDEARQIFIITDCGEAIGKSLLNDLGTGCTYLKAKGAWTGEEKTVVMAIVQKRVTPEVENIVKEKDPNAFMIVNSSNEIYGEGYKNLFADKL
ncbi:MAG: YitT family protein [Clostridia bacterium]|nr:YitT family protein [Clostridia bacterium]